MNGPRVICDQDGEIICIIHQMAGDVLPHKKITSLHHIDLEYDALDFSTHQIVGVDVETMKPILEEIPVPENEEQRKIRELEDALLLQADNDIGGIL